MAKCRVVMKEFLVQAYESWDGSNGKYQYKIIHTATETDAHAQALEFAFTLLGPYMNDIKHYAEYRAERFGDNPQDVIHETMLECAHYELWKKC